MRLLQIGGLIAAFAIGGIILIVVFVELPYREYRTEREERREQEYGFIRDRLGQAYVMQDFIDFFGCRATRATLSERASDLRLMVSLGSTQRIHSVDCFITGVTPTYVCVDTNNVVIAAYLDIGSERG